MQNLKVYVKNSIFTSIYDLYAKLYVRSLFSLCSLPTFDAVKSQILGRTSLHERSLAIILPLSCPWHGQFFGD